MHLTQTARTCERRSAQAVSTGTCPEGVRLAPLPGGRLPPRPPAGLRSLFLANFDLPRNTFFSKFKLWEIVFIGFLDPQKPSWDPGKSYTTNGFVFLTCSACPYYSLLSKCLVCYNGYQGFSWTRNSSRFLFSIKSTQNPLFKSSKSCF